MLGATRALRVLITSHGTTKNLKNTTLQKHQEPWRNLGAPGVSDSEGEARKRILQQTRAAANVSPEEGGSGHLCKL